MGQVIPRQHPAVVLKSNYNALRGLLAAALIAIVALGATVAILANDNDNDASAPAKATASQPQQLPAGTRFDGGPDEGTRGVTSNVAPAPGTRFDGGPDEGTRGLQAQSQSYWQQAAPRTSYQPVPDEGFKQRAGGPRFIPMGPSN